MDLINQKNVDSILITCIDQLFNSEQFINAVVGKIRIVSALVCDLAESLSRTTKTNLEARVE